jgi:hypothetical protein
MGKLKKKLKKKVNPEKSNKMIYAVVAGLVLIILIAFFAVVDFGPPADKKEMMINAMEYLEKGKEGVVDVKILPEQNKVIIVYDGNNPDKVDFKKVAAYAGLKLSNKMKDVEFIVSLVNDKDKEGKEEFAVISKGGRNIGTK